MNLIEKVRELPDKPGIYVLKGKGGEVIYVGKAISLKKRVPSYFQKGTSSPRIDSLRSRVSDLEWLVTDSEAEAFLLESNLIKHYRPRYNIRLRDDKSYPYIKLTTFEPFPRLFLTRNPEEDGSQYFGPYTDVKAARKILYLLHRFFPLRRCKGKFKFKEKPCLNYHIKECSAPCVGKISQSDYSLLVKGVSLFLQGHYEALLSRLKEEMLQASQEEEFERAAKIRDCIRGIQRISQTQKVTSFPGEDKDLIASVVAREKVCILVFLIREGKIVEKKQFFFIIGEEDKEGEMLSFFIHHYYAKTSFIPQEILIQSEIPELGKITEWFLQKKGKKVKLTVPKREKKAELMELAKKNAYLVLRREREKNKRRALWELKQYLNLKEEPWRIEGFDISNIQGKVATGSVVVFREGKAEKDGYRRFKIKNVKGIDDFAMLSEVIYRRYRRLVKEKLPLPQLILVDGGKGQVSSCVKVLKELNLEHIPLIGLAKGFEEVYLPYQSLPLSISRDSAALKLLQEIRDETHRFARSYHIKRRRKRIKSSFFDGIPGIGERTKKLLLTHFKSISEIKNIDELKKIPGIGEKTARKVLEYLNENAGLKD
ncbi:MAG: excinuclease ABC subunit UvrC [Candidatus Aerophobetes bacterium]|nr:excinuclease ABC subunit UvrC [Candidatus Aerophobetes bacterium]